MVLTSENGCEGGCSVLLWGQVINLSLLITLEGRYHCYPPLTPEETQAQR